MAGAVGEHNVVLPEPNAESAEFSRECDTDGDFDPVDGGLKNELGNLRMRNGTANGRFDSFGFSTLSKSACKLSWELSSTRTTRFSLAAAAAAASAAATALLLLLVVAVAA